MATKEENRAKLQRLREIVDGKLATFNRWGSSTGDGQVESVVTGLREALDEMEPTSSRSRRGGRDRQERGGFDRAEE
jgi:hypothetical protein